MSCRSFGSSALGPSYLRTPVEVQQKTIHTILGISSVLQRERRPPFSARRDYASSAAIGASASFQVVLQGFDVATRDCAD